MSGGAVRIEPAGGPQVLWEANPGSGAAGKVDTGLDVGLVGIPGGGSGTFKRARSNRTVSCGHVAGAGADLLIQ